MLGGLGINQEQLPESFMQKKCYHAWCGNYTLKFQRGKDGMEIKKGWQKPNELPVFSKEVSLGKLEIRERQKEDVFPPNSCPHYAKQPYSSSEPLI